MDKCKGCNWLYNGFCVCVGLKPCKYDKKGEVKTMAVRGFRTNDLVKEHDMYIDFMKKRWTDIKEEGVPATKKLFYKSGMIPGCTGRHRTPESQRTYVIVCKWHCISLTYDIWYDIAQNYAIDEGATTYKKVVDIPESMIKKFKYRVQEAIKNAECDYNKRINHNGLRHYDACRYLAIFWTYLDCVKDTKTQRFLPSLMTIERARKVFGYEEKENPFEMNGKFIHYSEEEKKPEVEEKPAADVSVSINDIMLEDMNFTMRTYTCLKRHGVDNLTDILKMTKRDLLMTRNLGRHSLEEILAKVKEYGFEYPGEKFDDCKDALPHPFETVVDIAEQVVKEMDEADSTLSAKAHLKLIEDFGKLNKAHEDLKDSYDKTLISAQELARQNDELIAKKLEYEQYTSRLRDDLANLKDENEGLKARLNNMSANKEDMFILLKSVLSKMGENKMNDLTMVIDGVVVDIHKQNGGVWKGRPLVTNYAIRTSEG